MIPAHNDIKISYIISGSLLDVSDYSVMD